MKVTQQRDKSQPSTTAGTDAAAIEVTDLQQVRHDRARGVQPLRARPLAAPAVAGATAQESAPALTARLTAAQASQFTSTELAAVNVLTAHSLSPRTLSNYTHILEVFVAYCAERHVCPLPAAPTTVAAYLTDLLVNLSPDSTINRDAGPPDLSAAQLQARLRPVTVAQHLAAINRAHRIAALPAPGLNPLVQAVIRGGRRLFGTRAVNAKEALTLDRLSSLVEAASVDPRAARDRLIVVLWGIGMNASAIERASAQDMRERLAMALTEDADADLTLALAESLATAAQAYDIDEALLPRQPEAAPLPASSRQAEIATALGPSSPGRPCQYGRVLPSLEQVAPEDIVTGDAGPDRAGMSRRAITTVLARACDSPTEGQLPRRTRAKVAAALQRTDGLSVRSIRDRALLLVLWSTAARRSSASFLDMGDLVEDPDGDVLVDYRRVKADATGQGLQVWLTPQPDPALCPVRAHHEWVATAEFVLADAGHSMTFATPYLLALRRDGSLQLRDGMPARLSGDAVYRLVASLALRAGFSPGRFGSHSLRSGWITEALNTPGVTPAQVQAVTGHANLETLSRYWRPVRNKEDNPNRRIGRSRVEPT